MTDREKKIFEGPHGQKLQFFNCDTIGLVAGDVISKKEYAPNDDFMPRHGWTVYDIGAHVGVYSCWAACYGARVYAFEADISGPDSAYSLLVKNIFLNGFNNPVMDGNFITPFPVAVAANAGRQLFRFGLEDLGNTLCHDMPRIDPEREPFEVGAVSFRSILDGKFCAGPINLLKMDIEGAEYECFASIAALPDWKEVLAPVERIAMEWHPVGDIGVIANLLTASGFDVELFPKWGANESGWGYGNLYAIRPCLGKVPRA